jgi:hypothetical protein
MSQCSKSTSRLLHRSYRCRNEGSFIRGYICVDRMKICLSLRLKRHICRISTWDHSIEPEIERSWRRTAVGKMKLNHVTNSLNIFMSYIKSTQGFADQGRIWHNWGRSKGYSLQGVKLREKQGLKIRQGEVKGEVQEIDGLGLGFWAPVLRFVSLLLLAFPCDSLIPD